MQSKQKRTLDEDNAHRNIRSKSNKKSRDYKRLLFCRNL